MMDVTVVQSWLVHLLAAGAGVYLAWNLFGPSRRAPGGGCGSCSACGTGGVHRAKTQAKKEEATRFVALRVVVGAKS